jgi:hypothetical protein
MGKALAVRSATPSDFAKSIQQQFCGAVPGEAAGAGEAEGAKLGSQVRIAG